MELLLIAKYLVSIGVVVGEGTDSIGLFKFRSVLSAFVLSCLLFLIRLVPPFPGSFSLFWIFPRHEV